MTGARASYDSMENPSEVTVTVTEGGILDDDLLAIRHLVYLARNRNNRQEINEWMIIFPPVRL